MIKFFHNSKSLNLPKEISDSYGFKIVKIQTVHKNCSYFVRVEQCGERAKRFKKLTSKAIGV